MSLSQTYRVAHTARGKLSSEASRGDHDLRLLVGHANLLDSLMVELQDAERDQERWFNSTVAANKASDAQPRKVQWVDQVVRDVEEDDEEDSDSDSEDGDDTIYSQQVPPMSPLRRIRSPPVSPVEEDDEDDYEEDDDADNEELSLVRTQSRYEEADDLPQSPPELVHDGEESDDDMPSSPPQPALAYGVMETDFAFKSNKPLVAEGDLLLEEKIFGSDIPLISAQA